MMNRRTFFKLLPALAAGTVAAAKARPVVKIAPFLPPEWQKRMFTDLVLGKRVMLVCKGRQMGWSYIAEAWHEFRMWEKQGIISHKKRKAS